MKRVSTPPSGQPEGRVTPLLGRTAELAAASEVLARLTEDSDAGVALLIGGDAGVGKTRLLRALVDEARDERVLIGHCMDFGGTGLPYLPFTEISGRLETTEPAFADELEGRFPSIARLRPSRRVLDRSVSGADDVLDRAAMFDDVLRALTALGADRPTLVVVEDAHWADRSTRDLLGVLLTRLPPRVAVVVTYRTDDLHRRHPLRPTVAAWSRLAGVHRLLLEPLASEAVRELIGYLHPSPLPERAVTEIVDRAEGNPFFVGELADAADVDAPTPNGRVRHAGVLPQSLLDTLLVRLDALPDNARSVVAAAAVAGRRVRHELLDAVLAESGAGTADVATGLRAAVDANVLETAATAQGDDEYGFRHALLAEAVYDDLLPGERIRLHGAYANSLRALGTLGTATELARHARSAGDLEAALDAEQRAAAEAMTVAAPDEALAHLESALEINARLHPTERLDHIELLRRASTAASAAGQGRRAIALGREAVAAFALPPRASDGEREQRANLLAGLARVLVAAEAEDEALVFTAEAVELVDSTTPSLARATAAAVHAHALMGVGRGADAMEWVRETERLAEALGRPELAVDVRTTAAWITRYAGDPRRAVHQIEAALHAAREVGDTWAELRSRHGLGGLRYNQLGDLHGALQAFSDNVARARELGRPWSPYGFESRTSAAQTYYVLGRWDEGDRLCDVRGERPPPEAEVELDATRTYSRAGRDEPGAEAALDRAPWRSDGWTAMRVVPAVVARRILLGRPDRALHLVEETVSGLTGAWHDQWFPARVRLSALAIEALAARADGGTDAERRAAALRAREWRSTGERAAEVTQSQYGRFGPEGLAQLAVLRAHAARMQWMAGDSPPAAEEYVALWRAAVQAFDYGDVFEQARSRLYLAHALRISGSADEAAAELTRARSTAQQLGAAPLLAAIDAVRGRPAAAGAPGLGALTDRERDVFGLVTQGRMNRQIATALFISEKTVSVHVSNILAKLGVHSRTEAAALARRQGWTSEEPNTRP